MATIQDFLENKHLEISIHVNYSNWGSFAWLNLSCT